MKTILIIAGISMVIIVAIVLATFGVPILINKAYNMNPTKIVTAWGATEALLFYGSALGGIATLASIVTAVLHDNKMRKADIQRNDAQRLEDKKDNEQQRMEDRKFYKEEREEEWQNYKKQREEDRALFKKDREEDWQNYKKQREEDRKLSMKRERYGIISKLLYDSLRNLDMRVFLDINKYADDYYNCGQERLMREHNQHIKKVRDFISPDTISYLIERTNGNMFLELGFLSEERTFFNRVLKELNDLTNDYISLLRKLEENKDSELRFTTDNTIAYWLDRFHEHSKELCHKYKEVSTSVEKTMIEYEHS